MKYLLLFLLLCSIMVGCVTLPDFITSKIENKEKVNRFTNAQKDAIALNDEAIEIYQNSFGGTLDSLPQAIALLERAMDIDSTNRTLFNNGVQILLKMGDTVKLVKLLDRMERSFSEDGNVPLFKGGVLYLQDSESVEANECFKRAKILFEKEGDTVKKMFCSMLAEDEESKNPKFKGDFKIALQLAGIDGGEEYVDNFNKGEFIRHSMGMSSAYDKEPHYSGEEDFEGEF